VLTPTVIPTVTPTVAPTVQPTQPQIQRQEPQQDPTKPPLSTTRSELFDADNWYGHYVKVFRATVSQTIPAKILVYECGHSHGLGNKFPGIISAFMAAMLTNRYVT
jgi:hypothetical protein